MTQTLRLISLGCPKNTVDSEVMLGFLQQSGFRLVDETVTPDVIVINTCGFIEAAKRESLDIIMESVALKQTHPKIRVVAAGCLVQRYRQELLDEIPELDAVIGVDEIPQLPTLLQSSERTFHYPSAHFIYSAQTPRSPIGPLHTVFVKISEGCSHGCSFCAIPSIRGPFRSRPRIDILDEIAQLTHSRASIKEVLLIGQDTTAWGNDLKPRDHIAHLLEVLAPAHPNVWIRLMYAYPSEITHHLLEVMARYPSICPYLDIPFQHSHPDILRAMGRVGDGDVYLRLIDKARSMIPGLAVRTTLITGFPGEREPHFRHLLDFVTAARFDHLGVFEYSDEEGTPAAGFPRAWKVRSETAYRRQSRLLKRQQWLLHRFGGGMKGQIVQVLVDGMADDQGVLLQGRLPQQAPEVDGVVLLNGGAVETAHPGTWVQAKLTGWVGYDYTADVLGPWI